MPFFSTRISHWSRWFLRIFQIPTRYNFISASKPKFMIWLLACCFKPILLSYSELRKHSSMEEWVYGESCEKLRSEEKCRVLWKQLYSITRGASPRRDDARLGSAHARNYRGMMPVIHEEIEAVNAIVLPRGTLKIIVLNEERKHWNQMLWTTATIFAVRHAITNNSSSCSNSTIASHKAVAEIHGRNIQIHTCTSYSRVQYNYPSGPGTLLWNHTRCL